MTKLASLRSQLANLRHRRQAVRWGTAYAALALTLLWTLCGFFLLDWLTEMSRPQRAVLLVVSAGIVYWAARKYVMPWLGVRENDLDMALLVERRQKIDSDLVAALQFESPEARTWGSTQLAGAVVDYVAEFGRGWNVFDGFTQVEMRKRFALLGATAAIVLVLAAIFPRHAGAFLNRLFLGSAHYPTRTVIDSILVNRHELFAPAPQEEIKSAFGQPMNVAVMCSGELPDAGRVELRTADTGIETTIDLVKETLADGKARYSGKLPKLIDSLNYQLYVGDAWTDPAKLSVAPLPVVDVRLTPTPPDYARGAMLPEDASPGSLQIAVIEGSQVAIEALCRNKKLASASIAIDGVRQSLESLPGLADDAKSVERWGLPAKATLGQVLKPVRFEIQVVDEDGLSLERPIVGFIRIKADQKPRITADIVTRFVLPAASPRIEYRASDDYGLSALRVLVQTVRAGSTPKDESPIDMRSFNKPMLSDKLPLKESYALNLSPLKLKKGDELRLTLEAIDYRGSQPGQSTLSEPLVLQVTDESGIYAAIAESDERSAKQMDAIINRQIGIGETK